MKPSKMKKLVLIASLMLVSTTAISQSKIEKSQAVVTSDSTTVKTEKIEISKDSTTTVAFVSKRAIIESNFDKASFLFRGRKSKSTRIC